LAAIVRPRGISLPRLRPELRGDRLTGLAAGVVVVYLVAVPLAVLLTSSVRDTTTKLPFEDTAFTVANPNVS